VSGPGSAERTQGSAQGKCPSARSME
jgi:hypothetical protein